MKQCIFIMLISGLFAFASCNKDDSPKQSTVGFYLTDAPAIREYKAVHIDVESVSYSLNNENWIDLPVQPGLIELLQFSNGNDSLLSKITLDAGVKIQQVRLILGDNNTLTLKDGTVVPLKTPSAQSSGLKINVQSTAEVTSSYRVVIDFDAARSIVAKGNGDYSLKPVIRAYIEANTSYIEGNLTPENKITRVFTLDLQGDTISTVSDTLNNNYFRLHGLFGGVYKIEVENLNTGEIRTLKDAVPVTGGTNVNLGTLALPEE